MEEDYKRR